LLVRILDSGQVLLLLVQVVLIHLFLELDVLLVNSVDLLSEILMLPLESLGQLVLLLDQLARAAPIQGTAELGQGQLHDPAKSQ
jgi:hypothetical protein